VFGGGLVGAGVFGDRDFGVIGGGLVGAGVFGGGLEILE
jgi:hypothetical protein